MKCDGPTGGSWNVDIRESSGGGAFTYYEIPDGVRPSARPGRLRDPPRRSQRTSRAPGRSSPAIHRTSSSRTARAAPTSSSTSAPSAVDHLTVIEKGRTGPCTRHDTAARAPDHHHPWGEPGRRGVQRGTGRLVRDQVATPLARASAVVGRDDSLQQRPPTSSALPTDRATPASARGALSTRRSMSAPRSPAAQNPRPPPR